MAAENINLTADVEAERTLIVGLISYVTFFARQNACKKEVKCCVNEHKREISYGAPRLLLFAPCA